MSNKIWIACIIILTIITFAFPAQAQQWSWPEKPQNLQVLPSDWPGSRLSAPMRGFTRALGVRCSYCHVGEEGQPLSTYDFVSDANPNKDRAREMLRMLGDINSHLKKIEPSGTKRVNMWCHTCHNGRPKPMTLGEELGETYRMKGLDAAIAQYNILKEKRTSLYNFGEKTLNDFGYEVLNDDPKGAVKIFKMNADTFPDSWNVWDSLADGYMKAGDLEKAKEYYKESLELNPRNQNAKNMLKKIQGSKK